MNNRIEDYKNVKTVFNNIIANVNISDISVFENKDTLALNLSIKHDNNTLNYYYVYGNSQVCRFYNDSDMRVLTRFPENLHKHILWDIEDFINGKKIN